MAIFHLLLFIFIKFQKINNFENNAQLIRFLQPDDVDSINFNSNDKKWSSSLCTRNCETDPEPRLCYYQFTLEQYTVMGPACYDCPLNISNCYRPQCVTADGIEKMILTANRRLPGPSIQVCQGDTVIVDVKNKMPGRSTAVHWHGLKQRGTPYMDGMPGVTQCPILSDQIFRYKFKTPNTGTFFWHSHDGTQKMDGLVGNLVVRGKYDSNREQYDLDLPSHVVLITDWMHETSDDHQPGLLRSNIGQEPDVYLVNGRGVYLSDLASMLKMSVASGVSQQLSMPLGRFIVKRGLRYRFRLIGGSCLSCPFRIYFQSHQLTLINMDMNSVKPVTVDVADISSGERFDFVINANQPEASYWIYVTGLGACKSSRGVAVLQYEGSLVSKPLTPLPGITNIPNGSVFNRRNSVCRPNTKQDVCVTQLRSQRRNPRKLVQPPDARILVNFIFYQFNRKTLFEEEDYKRYFAPYNPFTNQIALLTSVVKNVSNSMPSTPLLSQLTDITDSKFCSDECLTPRVNATPCDCLLLVKVPLGSVVEILFVDDSEISEIAISHPFHMHGYEFYIMETGLFTAGDRQTQVVALMERLESQSYSRSDYPSKDTIDVPAYGYAVTRIVADNPGFWFVHCHFIYHLITGMSLVIQVGEMSEMPAVPRGFPTCDDFLSPDASLL